MIRDIVAGILTTVVIMKDYFRNDFIDEFRLGGKYYPRGETK